MTGRLTTHVLDTAKGRPAAGLRITLDRIGSGNRTRLAEAVTNADGRTDQPMLEDPSAGLYELTFHAGTYLGEAAFLDTVPVRFRMEAGQHYHVPLLLSPYGYSTYRGS